MKHKQKRSPLRRLSGLVTQHFKLKLLSLALAILLYELIAPSTLPEKDHESENKKPPVLMQIFQPQISQYVQPTPPQADTPPANTNTTDNVNTRK